MGFEYFKGLATMQFLCLVGYVIWLSLIDNVTALSGWGQEFCDDITI